MNKYADIIAEEMGLRPVYVDNVISLIDEGNTIPFIARYRKEMHGTMDDTTLRNLDDRLRYLRNLGERKDAVIKSIEDQGKMTEELASEIDAALTLARLEDIYRPYKQKKKTRASIAKAKGLEPLASALLLQTAENPEKLALQYIDEEKGVENAEQALAGASDIIAEMLSDDADLRESLREELKNHSSVRTAAAKEEDSVYAVYYDFSRSYSKMAGHQTLAINRGEKEEFLTVSLVCDEDKLKDIVRSRIIHKSSPSQQLLTNAADDALSRLIFPSLERELRNDLTDSACEGAIHNFALNLKPLLMQPPVKGKVTMGLDPGYRNGCKVAVIDPTGKVLDTTVVYPTFSEARREECIQKLSVLIRKHGVEHIAIGNGTASRETQSMAADMIKRLGLPLSYAMVNEAGASVYSASPLAAAEFPDYDVNLRSAVSIARRLQDPLAELVKIEPMAIGVGQYQHDMPQARLADTLNGVVEDCVNAVGVDINTASVSLLERVSGLTKSTAKNIVAMREAEGPFKSRAAIKKVPRLGPKAYEQCAGFLRVPESKDFLDRTSVHPESYEAARKIISLCGYSDADMKKGSLPGISSRIAQLGKEKLAAEAGIGVPTLSDIASELEKPGRDIREDLPPVVLSSDVLDISDLREGMKLRGTVRNVIDFGVFVDIGVHQDGLVHISQISEKFIKHPSELLSVGDIVDVVVLSVDAKKNRISLSIKDAKKAPKSK